MDLPPLAFKSTYAISGHTRLYGIIGDPVSHSLSPAMHNAAFASLGLDACYVPLPVEGEAVEAALKGLYATAFQGLNVTMPHKEVVIEHLYSLSQEATLTQSVNTLVRNPNGWHGETTDGYGLVFALNKAGITLKGSRVLLIGGGGVARSVAFSLAKEGIGRLCVVNRTPERVQRLLLLLKTHFPDVTAAHVAWDTEKVKSALSQSDILINATPLDLGDDPLKVLPFSADSLSKQLLICELSYAEHTSRLAKTAKDQGARILEGKQMLLYQGMKSFSLWTGLEPPVEVMRHAAGI